MSSSIHSDNKTTVKGPSIPSSTRRRTWRAALEAGTPFESSMRSREGQSPLRKTSSAKRMMQPTRASRRQRRQQTQNAYAEKRGTPKPYKQGSMHPRRNLANEDGRPEHLHHPSTKHPRRKGTL